MQKRRHWQQQERRRRRTLSTLMCSKHPADAVLKSAWIPEVARLSWRSGLRQEREQDAMA